jgi:hypothetical protein
MNNYKETVNKFSEEQIRTILTQERPIDACRLLDCSKKIYYKTPSKTQGFNHGIQKDKKLVSSQK